MIHGLGTALITPFHADGSVDYEGLDKLLDIQLTGHVDFLVVLGTTAEAATMTEEEKQSVWQFVVNKVNGRLPLVLGLGGNNTAQVIESLNSKLSTTLHSTLSTLHSCAAILSVCPYYNKPSQEGLFRHFSAIAKVSPVPIILYNVPGRTGVNLLPETVMRIYEAFPDKIMGIKEASGNLEQIKHLLALRDNFKLSTNKLNNYSKLSTLNSTLKIFSGDDNLAAELMAAGADGLISVASNAYPEAFGQIVHQADKTLQDHYADLVKYLFIEGNPSGIKTVLSQMGVIENHLRLPLVPNSESIQKLIQQCIRSL